MLSKGTSDRKTCPLPPGPALQPLAVCCVASQGAEWEHPRTCWLSPIHSSLCPAGTCHLTRSWPQDQNWRAPVDARRPSGSFRRQPCTQADSWFFEADTRLPGTRGAVACHLFGQGGFCRSSPDSLRETKALQIGGCPLLEGGRAGRAELRFQIKLCAWGLGGLRPHSCISVCSACQVCPWRPASWGQIGALLCFQAAREHSLPPPPLLVLSQSHSWWPPAPAGEEDVELGPCTAGYGDHSLAV